MQSKNERAGESGLQESSIRVHGAYDMSEDDMFYSPRRASLLGPDDDIGYFLQTAYYKDWLRTVARGIRV